MATQIDWCDAKLRYVEMKVMCYFLENVTELISSYFYPAFIKVGFSD